MMFLQALIDSRYRFGGVDFNMALRILIMGLPGSGKTTLAQRLRAEISVQTPYSVDWHNADEVRTRYNDWDFSPTGHIRQAMRMRELALQSDANYVIVDFIAALEDQRQIFQPDITIWMDTIDQGRYDDTNKMFEPPKEYDFRIIEQDAVKWAEYIVKHITM